MGLLLGRWQFDRQTDLKSYYGHAKERPRLALIFPNFLFTTDGPELVAILQLPLS